MKLLFTVLLVALRVFSFGQAHDLSYFLTLAERNSPVLKDYQNQILSVAIDSQLYRASLHTQVNFISTNTYAPVIKGWGYDEIITNKANIAALVQASRNFYNRMNVAAQYRNIALQKRALLDTIMLSRHDLVRSITEQYITAYGDLLTMDFNKEVLDLMQREEGALKKLTEASVYKQTDYLSFYVTMQQQELLYLQGQIQYHTDYLTLNYLCGVVDTLIERISAPVLSDTLRREFTKSVFYNRFVTDSLRMANERAIINYEYRPRIGVYSDAGYNSSLQLKPYKNFGFSAGVSVTIPIYDGHQKQLKYQKIDIREKNRQSNKEFVLNQFQQQLILLRQQMELTQNLVNKIHQQIDFTHTLILANEKLLQTGDITMKEYVTSINNYLAAQNLLTQNTLSRMRVINQINYWNR